MRTPTKPALHKALTDSIVKQRPPLRRLTTQAIGHNEHTGRPHRRGWAGVVEELQDGAWTVARCWPGPPQLLWARPDTLHWPGDSEL